MTNQRHDLQIYGAGKAGVAFQPVAVHSDETGGLIEIRWKSMKPD